MIRSLAFSLVLALPFPLSAQELRLNVVQHFVTLEKSGLVYAQALHRDGRWVIEIRFAFLAAGKFREITGRYVRQNLQIVAGDRIVSESMIMGQIDHGTVVLEGNLTEAQAKEIAAKLR